MPKGEQEGESLEQLRIFRRPTKEGEIKYFARLGIWVRNKNILAVDRALRQLREIEPEKSLSEIVCEAIQNEANRAKKRISNTAKSD